MPLYFTQDLTTCKTTMCFESESITYLLEHENKIFMTLIDKELRDSECSSQRRISCMLCL